ncbi:MAG: hypothetical protein E7629_04735 [Ruminococcaceae bacterium]|nr:hypothetical protein [Oscillospiraceae bacterium]
MKKLFCILLALLLFVSCITGETPETSTESSSVEAPTTAPTEESAFHEWYDPDSGYYNITSNTYQDFLADKSLHPYGGLVDFESLNVFGFQMEFLYVAPAGYHQYLCDWNSPVRKFIEVNDTREVSDWIDGNEWVSFEEMGDTLLRMPDKYFSGSSHERYVKVGNAIYQYSGKGTPPIIYFVANGRSIQLSILYSNGTTLEDEGEALKNLYDPSTAPAQIDAILAQWEGKW